MSEPLLSVENLTVERGGRVVLSTLGFTLAPGETLLVSGRNGAGKSTLLRTIAGLLQPTVGHVRFGLASDDVRGVETVHYLGYEDALKPSLTVGENLAFWSAMLATRHSGAPEANPESVRRTPPETSTPVPGSCVASPGMTAEDALAAYGIARLHDLPAGYLSAGQKRRVALARLLVAPRPIWLLDEPLIALDEPAQKRVLDLMSAHVAAGGGILVASHQPLALTTRQIDLDAVPAQEAA